MSETPKSEVSSTVSNQYICNSGEEDCNYDFDTITEACACIGLYIHENMIVLNETPAERSSFDACSEPVIGIIPYYQRICRYSRLTPESACCALVLARQICANPENGLQLTNFNAHRLLLTASMVFAKFYDDDIDTNIRWAKIAGIQLPELNSLEIDFLNSCNFDLRVSKEDFDSCLTDLLALRDQVPKIDSLPQPVCRSASAKGSSTRSPPSRLRQQPHTIQFSPQSGSRMGAASPNSRVSPTTPASPGELGKDRSRMSDSFDTPSPVLSPNGHSRRRGVSGALIAFLHHPRFHHHHHERANVPPFDNATHLSGTQGTGCHAQDSNGHHIQESTSSPTSPSASPHHGFHLRMPRSSSLHSLTNLLHVSPRFKGSKSHKKHHNHEGAAVSHVNPRDSSEIDGVVGFVSRPSSAKQSGEFVPPSIPSRQTHTGQDISSSSCIPNNNHVGPEVVANVLAH